MENGKSVAGICAGSAGINSEETDALSYLQSVYRNPMEPTSVRMRAAAFAIQFESPKLAASAISSMDGEDFAAMLERAIARSRNPPPMIEHRPSETVPGVQWSGPIGGNNDEG